MTKGEFNNKFSAKINTVENTNYGSIKTQIDLALLIQEFYLRNSFSKQEIIALCKQVPYNDIGEEAQIEVLGELISNLEGFHRCVSILEDLGVDFINHNMKIMNGIDLKGKLFNECNVWD